MSEKPSKFVPDPSVPPDQMHVTYNPITDQAGPPRVNPSSKLVSGEGEAKSAGASITKVVPDLNESPMMETPDKAVDPPPDNLGLVDSKTRKAYHDHYTDTIRNKEEYRRGYQEAKDYMSQGTAAKYLLDHPYDPQSEAFNAGWRCACNEAIHEASKTGHVADLISAAQQALVLLTMANIDIEVQKHLHDAIAPFLEDELVLVADGADITSYEYSLDGKSWSPASGHTFRSYRNSVFYRAKK